MLGTTDVCIQDNRRLGAGNALTTCHSERTRRILLTICHSERTRRILRLRPLAFAQGDKHFAPRSNHHPPTHVAGIAAGNGTSSGGKYAGIAPEANLAAVKILDAEGKGSAADVLAGVQWLIDNRERYNIRIANLSIGTADAGSSDPLVRAVEAAWDAGIVMLVAAGNNGPASGSVTSPGISRKVITVGASDDNRTVTIWGDSVVHFSGRGPTTECIVKPDVVAPGAEITSCLTNTPISDTRRASLRIVSPAYVEMSGTSMSTPMVAGAVALLLEKHPALTPNEVKLWLKQSTVSLRYTQNQQGWGLLDVGALLRKGDVQNGQ